VGFGVENLEFGVWGLGQTATRPNRTRGSPAAQTVVAGVGQGIDRGGGSNRLPLGPRAAGAALDPASDTITLPASVYF